MVKYIIRLDADHRLWIALGTGGVVFLLAGNQALLQTRLLIAYVAYAFTILLLTWTTIIASTPQETKKTNRLEDSNRLLILAFVVIGAFASLFAVVLLVKSVRSLSSDALTGHILLSALAVVFSWFIVHTVFLFRYAHIYYGTAKEPTGGLDFPSCDKPDYLDFAYFSFVIGMTSQVSDVQITSSVMRRLALVHGILSFVFNAVIIALSINTISGLIGH